MNKWSYEDIMPRSACSIGAYVRRCTPPVENRTRSSCFMDASRAGVNQWLSESANSAQSEFTAQASLCGLLSKSQYLMPLIAFFGNGTAMTSHSPALSFAIISSVSLQTSTLRATPSFCANFSHKRNCVPMFLP